MQRCMMLVLRRRLAREALWHSGPSEDQHALMELLREIADNLDASTHAIADACTFFATNCNCDAILWPYCAVEEETASAPARVA